MKQIKQVVIKPKLKKKKRAAVYVRVSSAKDAAIHSSYSQINGLMNAIEKHPDWEFTGAYVDEGKSGTKDTRRDFQKLLADCRAGEIDVIVTKAVSRFARNTITLLETVRELKALGINVYFAEQNIHTMSSEGELLLTLLASFAEEEAKSVSGNMLWRVHENFINGKPWSHKILGYRLVDGRYIIKEDEAEIVRRIFAEYLAGSGYIKIAKRLNADNIPTSNGPPWSANTVANILKNFNYTGNLWLQKTYREDFRTKMSKKNRGERDAYKVIGTHEPIIDIADFDRVQDIMAERAERFTKNEKTGFEHFDFTSKIRCALCNKNFNRITSRGEKYWMCRTYAKRGKEHCQSKRIPERTLISLCSDIGIENIEHIDACNDNTLIFNLHSGKSIVKHWQDRSRAESWTPEMKERARRQTCERMGL